MSRRRELQRLLGSHYSYERYFADRDIQRLRREMPDDFTDMVVAVLTAGCLRLTAVLYPFGKELRLGYDLFVKDDPDSPEWIFYDGLEDIVSLKETDMLRVLDRAAAAHDLSYTESCFDTLDGKALKESKPPL